ncbi:response regulator transcription factor [Lachnoclostridium phytofermentans]|uniref:response regulator n=1 Tax=Lachnoclostridium phytofermentans TaxID=66219 RepID=UPI000A6F8F72|nr:response regulator transcription factor [Lachnoclostridium phytofermentans]
MGIIRIVIADDHKMVREGLKQLLELDGDIQVVGEASDGEQCLQKVVETNPDVLLLDINMPAMNGLQTLQELRRNNNKQKVLMLTIHNEIEYLLRAVDIGVNGYILKDSESSVLKKAIYTIYQGETHILNHR